VFTTHNFYHSW